MNSEYQAYLLRLKRGQKSEHWRATLQNAHTGEQFDFATEREMLIYLWRLLDDQSPADDVDLQLPLGS